MRQFSMLVIVAVILGGAAILYEQESRKVKGVLTQLTELQAQLGDLQAEVTRLNGELEAAKLAWRRQPSLRARARPDQRAAPVQIPPSQGHQASPGSERELIASDVTTAPPVIRRDEEAEDRGEWSRPTVDAEEYQRQNGNDASTVDPYQ
ncbi:hypothetical protein [Microbulbifer sp. TYP-18]|uniref:hypothetical protein n=1 Tax=Microbulbifer sp. TYP-18 TaxID=3230024 RepID=UPI0034C6D44E